nr:hypothetical protein [Kibdelosporangium sp. MJ126-NF4]CEL15876.1 hypothetical protein [Kibdelosporangium sp. MJ126-NF4]CTQ93801.1 hypothetical protein [Kibdelosporangium sp. MJ126-NF4]
MIGLPSEAVGRARQSTFGRIAVRLPDDTGLGKCDLGHAAVRDRIEPCSTTL